MKSLNYLLGEYYAIIFDYDGTIVNSTQQHYRAYVEAFKSVGIDFTSIEISWQGRSTEDVIAEVLVLKRIHTNFVRELVLRKREIFSKSVRVEALSPMPYVFEFLNACRALGKSCYIASGSGRQSITYGLEKLNIKHFFEAIYCIEDVVSGKPAPDLFKLVLDENRLSTDKCLVIEDSDAGFAAAKCCGLACVDVADLNLLLGDKN